MVDPTAAVAIAAVVGGSTSKMVEITWNAGSKWLSDYFKDHEEKAAEAAEKNALVFLNDLAERVKALEEQGMSKERIESALDDPDFAATLKTALIGSARTSDPEKHEILGRAVAERLGTEPEGLVALASSLAIEAVPYLSPMHLTFLGATTLVYAIRPNPFPPQDVSPEEFQDWYISWLRPLLARCLEPEIHMRFLDYAHLVSVSCLDYDTLGERKVEKVLGPRDEEKYTWDPHEFLGEDTVGMELTRVWKEGMQHVMLASAGHLIGVYVKDQKTGTNTTIDW